MPTIRKIQAAVAARYGVSAADLVETRTGGRSNARPRLLVMWLARQCTSYNLSRIGRHFGGRDHKTVANAIRRVDQMMAQDRALAETAQQIRGALV